MAAASWFAADRYGLALLRGSDGPAWRDAPLQTRPAEIEPRLALLALAGWSDHQLFEMALSQGQVETAYATLAYSTQLTDRERTGLWLSLAQRLTQAGETDQAVLCFQQAATVAVLSPSLADLQRAEALSQASLGLARLDTPQLAARLAQQTLVIARRSPQLPPVLRQQLVERAAQVYGLLGDEEQRRQALEGLDQVARVASAEGGTANAPLLPTFEAQVALPPAVQQATDERKAAALRTAQSADPAAGSHEGLARSLLQEDTVMETQLHTVTDGQVRLSIHAAAAKHRVSWLTVKYRVARGDYGVSLVPQWEAQANEIRSDLARAYESLFDVYKDQAVALPLPQQVQQGWVEVLREEAKLGRLGLYPNYPEVAVAEGLQQRQDEWLAGRPEVPWRIADTRDGGHLEFALVGR
ncbi:MAG: hypothetical protein GX605_13830 [Chloroflexi bacterium]|nr:hypothetical protein [Chloroflexota bacterium]